MTGRDTWRALVAGGALLLVAGASGTVWAETGSSAPAAAGLGGFSIEARAPGFETTFDEPAAQTHPEGQGTVPQTLAQLKTGPVGFAQAAIAWPGTLLGNAGDTIIAGGGSSFPASQKGTAHQLNDPVRSESRVGEGSPDSSYTGAPGSTMTTHADAERVQADADVKSLASPGGSAGSIASSSKSILQGSIGVASATSRVSNIVLGPANVITIDSVTSTAIASTDGTTAKASGSTNVNGMKVAGVPVTVDQNGVAFGPAKDPVNTRLNDLAAQALAKSGFKILLTKPDGTPQGSAVDYNAGSLVISWEPQPGTIFSVTLGGAIANVNSTPGFDTLTVPDTPVTTPASGSAETPSASGGTASVAAPSSGGPAASAASGSSGPATVPVAATPISFFGGLPIGWVVLGLTGAAAAAFGLRKLSTDVLAEQAAVCRLERKSS
ncbi:MAG: hypothetical protein JWO37_960 [Acidimicrobiales bacterium]|nr:hypothetical protein [Acidimicrobiales bacterium]